MVGQKKSNLLEPVQLRQEAPKNFVPKHYSLAFLLRVPMEMNWTCVLDALPEIPEGHFCVSVLVVTYDYMEADCFKYRHPMIGVDVSDGMYGYVTHKRHPMNMSLKMGFHEEGDPISRWFKDWKKEKDFITQWYGGEHGSEPGPFGDPVTHWMYFPKAPGDYDYRKYFGYTDDELAEMDKRRNERMAERPSGPQVQS